MTIDMTALSAAPSPDAACASAETPAGASDAFSALLDEAAGATGESDSPSRSRSVEDKGEDDFDELAAMAMTSLLSIGATVPQTTDAGDGDEIAVTEITDQAVDTDVTLVPAKPGEGGSRAVDVSVPPSPTTTIGNDMGVDPNVALVMTDATVNRAAETTPQTLPEVTRESASIGERTTNAAPAAISQDTPKVAATSISETAAADAEPSLGITTSSAGKADTETKSAAKAARSSKSSRAAQGTVAHTGNGLDAPAAGSSSPATAGQKIDETRAAVQVPQAVDVRAPGSTAARFARALERAAALTTNEATSGAASAASSDGGEQQTGFGDSTPNREAQLSAALRQSVPGGVTFTMNGPVPLDARAVMAAVAGAAGHGVETAPMTIPERDVIAQLVQSLRVQFRDGIGEAVVKLKPEHLGSVQISIRIENGAIKATVQAEAAAVRQWLESQQDTLRTSLAEQGLRLERFVVEPDGERQTAQDDTRRQREQRRRHDRRMSAKDQPAFEVTV